MRWSPPSDGEFHYLGDLSSNGGIPPFLAHKYRLMETSAMELATRGAALSAAPDMAFLEDLVSGSDAHRCVDCTRERR